MKIKMIHDFINPETGNTYKEDNLKLEHSFEVGSLVEYVDTGVRLFVVAHQRDCDGSLLYALGSSKEDIEKYNEYLEESKGLTPLQQYKSFVRKPQGVVFGYP